MRTLIAYLSYSGNTEEIAEHIERKLVCEGIEVDMLSIGIDYVPDLSVYDYIFLGTFTWDMGGTPDEVKDFVLEVGYKPNNVAVFGSGDTQFGGDAMFCGAVDKLVKFYESKWDGLKIEQSPRGSQEVLIDNWLEGVLEDVRVTA
ncbi:flavodoxin [Pseudogracilibacillus sp. ICA-222130]|uniref:flavodoxin n=1 Tax=Pseudogracilibacillus sp. ICA-222130 TaxID=3134655 RepID=UPI0030BD16C6